MSTTDIATGSADGLISFIDFMVQKGYGTARSLNLAKSATKQVFSIVEGEDYGGSDVRTFDIGEYLTRFENRSMGRYSADTLAAYRSRFRRAVESYRSYLADPNWKPAARPAGARRTVASDSSNGSQGKPKGRSVGAGSQAAPRPPLDIPASVITYPFPLKSGHIAQLHLPTQLDREDAERMTTFIRALVFDQPRQLPPGEGGDQ
jgi:hypothetical protein